MVDLFAEACMMLFTQLCMQMCCCVIPRKQLATFRNLLLVTALNVKSEGDYVELLWDEYELGLCNV